MQEPKLPWKDAHLDPPKQSGRYIVHRKDGKIHQEEYSLETYNGSGWAYNYKVITHYLELTPP